MKRRIPYRTFLKPEQLPKCWYNIKADMKELPPPLINPATMRPVSLDELSSIFADELARQELNCTDRFIEIPNDILEYYETYRPSPLIRAYNLERRLQTPARIYYKFEGGNTSGSHKLNSAVAQAYYAKRQGLSSLTTETGAGQWGTALAMACAHFNLPLTVYMVKISALQKPHRKAVIESFGGKVIPSPSTTTAVGRKILSADPNSGGSLGCAISEAVETAANTPNCRYVLGSVLDQVLLHQSVIGLEAKAAMDSLDEYPDIIIGCAGGGSNLGGLICAYMGDKLNKRAHPHFIAVEPDSCPSLTRGQYAYDFCDAGRITPLARMYTLGSGFVPSGIHAGGLRYHGMSPIISKLYHDGHIDEARAVSQTSVFDAAMEFSTAEGILPAPESAHAIKVAIDEAKKCRESGERRVILFNLTGTGYFDMSAYIQYHAKEMTNHSPSDEELCAGLKSLPKLS
ncbi:MAG: TrpB-like pyridoxal phosphate-dependent enzyme [Clostridia bacterium]|nr:TrpB-like pyridoxal phosphate-dependent enzyme [Clostridia bacterium]